MNWRILSGWVIGAWLLATHAYGQSDKVILVGIPLGVSVDRSLGLTSGTSPTTDNQVLLTNSFANSGQLHSVYFPGKVWGFRAHFRLPCRVSTVSEVVAAFGGGELFETAYDRVLELIDCPG
ncbi:MAG: hypothetical protein AB7G28_17000, partial [Pirellulales bacterium]